MDTDDPNQSSQPTDPSNDSGSALTDLVDALQSVDTESPEASLNATSIEDNNGGRIAKSPIPEVKDQICRLIFLNLAVDDKKVLSYQLKPSFDALLKYHHQSLSRGPGN